MITIDLGDRTPIYEQIVKKIKEMILVGVFQPDEQLPSVRSLAMDLQINPNTIQRAYAELERQGVIFCVTGKGNFVSGSNDLVNREKEEICATIEKDAVKAKKLGVKKDEVINLVNSVYEGGSSL